MHLHFKKLFCVAAIIVAQSRAPAADPTSPAGRWGDWKQWGDLGDGTYRNPVLPSDYSDIDCIRVGSDYYAISSTFQFSPGMVILHSRDMVNWTILSHAVSDLREIGPELNWDRMNRYGKGIWAGAIRYHDHKFWIYFGTPQEGYFMTTAENPSGPWAPLHCLLAGSGWDDPCPFWDDDGQGYFVGTHFQEGYKIHLFKLSADGKDLVKESDRVIHQSKGSEANKLYKINGIYYHLFSEVRPEGRTVMMERSQSILGPYDEVHPLSHADREAMEPNQGGLVETEKGDWYFYTHHGRGSWEGRCDSLLPVTWVDGWPLIGEVGPDGIGRMVWSGKKPVAESAVSSPQSSDEFDSRSLGAQWEWNYQPRPEKWSLTERSGWMRLHASKPLEADNLLTAANTLTQRCFRTGSNVVVAKFDLSGMVDGQSVGLCHFAKLYSTCGIIQSGDVRRLEYRNGVEVRVGDIIESTAIWIKSSWGLDGLSQYAFSVDGETFTNFGNPYQLSWGNYRGDRIGLFSYNNKSEAGYLDVDFFHYTYR